MIIGVGFDLVDLADFGRTLERSGEPFLKRVYTAQEIEYCKTQPHSGQSYALRFAAKEAAMKALGVAGEEGLQWRDFEVVLAASGEPQMVLHGKAATKARALKIRHLLLSLSHSMSSAGAVAIAEASPRSAGRKTTSKGSEPTSKKRAAPRTNGARL